MVLECSSSNAVEKLHKDQAFFTTTESGDALIQESGHLKRLKGFSGSKDFVGGCIL